MCGVWCAVCGVCAPSALATAINDHTRRVRVGKEEGERAGPGQLFESFDFDDNLPIFSQTLKSPQVVQNGRVFSRNSCRSDV